MFDPNTYRKLCGTLTAPEEKVQEVILMTQKTDRKKIIRHHPLRKLVVAAATVSALAVGASAATNFEAIQDMFISIAVTNTSGTDVLPGILLPEVHLEEREDRTLLVIDGKETDITDQMKQEGGYTERQDLEDGGVLEVAVDPEKRLSVKGYDADGTLVYQFQQEEGAVPDGSQDTYTFRIYEGDGTDLQDEQSFEVRAGNEAEKTSGTVTEVPAAQVPAAE